MIDEVKEREIEILKQIKEINLQLDSLVPDTTKVGNINHKKITRHPDEDLINLISSELSINKGKRFLIFIDIDDTLINIDKKWIKRPSDGKDIYAYISINELNPNLFEFLLEINKGNVSIYALTARTVGHEMNISGRDYNTEQTLESISYNFGEFENKIKLDLNNTFINVDGTKITQMSLNNIIYATPNDLRKIDEPDNTLLIDPKVRAINELLENDSSVFRDTHIIFIDDKENHITSMKLYFENYIKDFFSSTIIHYKS